MKSLAPRVTVLMAVYNGERFLRPAIESILNQTFTDYELLIVDDASTDSTPAVIRSYQDPRIRVIHNERNVGARVSRNLGLQNARGEYVAVLDADDVAYPQRLVEQVVFLDAHPEIALLGSAYDSIDECGDRLQTLYQPTESLIIRWTLLFRNCIAHSTVMYRREAALQVGGYDPNPAEDFLLWGRMAAVYRLAQVDKVLAMYRLNAGQLTQLDSRSGVLRQYTVEVVRQNIRACTQEAVTLQIAACLHGSGGYVENTIMDQAYSVLWKCLRKVIVENTTSRKDRQRLFQVALTDLLRLARQSEAKRLKALEIAARYALLYTPAQLLSPRFLRFVFQIVLPARIRSTLARFLRRVRSSGWISRIRFIAAGLWG